MKRMLIDALLVVCVICVGSDLSAQATEACYLSDGGVVPGKLLVLDNDLVHVRADLGGKSSSGDSIWTVEKDVQIARENLGERPSAAGETAATRSGSSEPSASPPVGPPLIGIGGMIGVAVSLVDKVFEEVEPDAQFEPGLVARGSVTIYAPTGHQTDWGTWTVGLELGVSRFGMDLGVDYADLKAGTLNMTSLMLLGVVQQFPDRYPGMGVHASLGFAYGLTSLDRPKTAGSASLETENSVFLQAGGGGGVFLSRNFGLCVGFAFMFGDIEVTDPSQPEELQYVDTILATNVQFMGGVTVLF